MSKEMKSIKTLLNLDTFGTLVQNTLGLLNDAQYCVNHDNNTVNKTKFNKVVIDIL